MTRATPASSENLYEILGVDTERLRQNPTQAYDLIEGSYRRNMESLMATLHTQGKDSSKVMGVKNKLAELDRAFEILMDPEARMNYDEKLAQTEHASITRKFSPSPEREHEASSRSPSRSSSGLNDEYASPHTPTAARQQFGDLLHNIETGRRAIAEAKQNQSEWQAQPDSAENKAAGIAGWKREEERLVTELESQIEQLKITMQGLPALQTYGKQALDMLEETKKQRAHNNNHGEIKSTGQAIKASAFEAQVGTMAATSTPTLQRKPGSRQR